MATQISINFNNNIPDGTYFTMSDVSPEIQGDTLTAWHGTGTRRSWGKPSVTSTVAIHTETLISVHVGFSHKHRGGQGWHHFTSSGDGWQKATWAQLSQAQRQQIFDVYEASRIPAWELAKMEPAEQETIRAKRAGLESWVKSPGKLERKTAERKVRTAFKLVRVEGEKLISLYDTATEYQIGKLLRQKAQEDHGGGYYAYPTIEGVKSLWQEGELVPARCTLGVTKLALLEVEASGTIVEYGTKFAATYLRPLRVVEFIEVQA